VLQDGILVPVFSNFNHISSINLRFIQIYMNFQSLLSQTATVLAHIWYPLNPHVPDVARIWADTMLVPGLYLTMYG